VSTILEVVRRGSRHTTPVLRVRCACGREYVTAQWPRDVRRATHCIACRTGNDSAKAHRAWATKRREGDTSLLQPRHAGGPR
jgi:hypothetical protein